MKKAKEDWIGVQCEKIKTCLNKNNSKRAYQLVKDLISEKQGLSTTIETSLRNVLQKNKRFLADGQNTAQNCTTMSYSENAVLDCNQPPEEYLQQLFMRKL